MLQELLSLDYTLFWLINRAHTPTLDVFFAAVTFLGTGWITVPIIVSIISLRPPPGNLNRIIVIAVVAVSVSGVVNTLTIKPIVKRPRPIKYFAQHPEHSPVDETGRRVTVHVVGKPLRYRSFPSGHTNTAFAATGVLLGLYGSVAWWALPAAVLVGYSRVYLGAHFPLDVLVGGLLGIVISWVIVTRTRGWWQGDAGRGAGAPEEAPQHTEVG